LSLPTALASEAQRSSRGRLLICELSTHTAEQPAENSLLIARFENSALCFERKNAILRYFPFTLLNDG
jgi:hypothetical protein